MIIRTHRKALVTPKMDDEWETLATGAVEDVMLVALRSIAAHVRWKEYCYWAMLIAALGWGTALPLLVWWFTGHGAVVCP